MHRCFLVPAIINSDFVYQQMVLPVPQGTPMLSPASSVQNGGYNLNLKFWRPAKSWGMVGAKRFPVSYLGYLVSGIK
ncbi:hypothetical protein AVEN_95273-1 [Araneus ventricosus]|uniref:Uncharacterized protein n=1 Tax=Araneus ventricosus TaxID=182803 RepID=A0A4Y2DFR2_ARAVE|nr:hypothetical protein AVEN_95273-1 [Araneus ventricosus]